jgi:hypothetical protein
MPGGGIRLRFSERRRACYCTAQAPPRALTRSARQGGRDERRRIGSWGHSEGERMLPAGPAIAGSSDFTLANASKPARRPVLCKLDV